MRRLKKLNPVEIKEILARLASGETRKNIAAKYNTNEKAISRVRDRALISSDFRNSLPEDVKLFLTHYEQVHKKIGVGSYSQQQTQIIEKHFDDLATCAKDVVKRLRTYKEEADKEEWPKETMVQEMLEGLENEEDFDDIEFFSKKITRGLLAHLAKSELCSELKTLPSITFHNKIYITKPE